MPELIESIDCGHPVPSGSTWWRGAGGPRAFCPQCQGVKLVRLEKPDESLTALLRVLPDFNPDDVLLVNRLALKEFLADYHTPSSGGYCKGCGVEWPCPIQEYLKQAVNAH